MIRGLQCAYSLDVYAEKHMLSNSEDEGDSECTISFTSLICSFVQSISNTSSSCVPNMCQVLYWS